MKEISIAKLTPDEAEKSCREITEALPAWFGVPEANERYAKGVRERATYGILHAGKVIGIVCLEFPDALNANIYWLGIKPEYHRHGYGRDLICYVVNVCRNQGCCSLSVETLSPKANDAHYLNTYRFYQKCGFRPLFELSPYGPAHLMVYLYKQIALGPVQWIDLTHVLTERSPSWEGGCGYQHTTLPEQGDFIIQKINMFTGIGTHIDSPAHYCAGAAGINALALEDLIAPCVMIDVSAQADENYRITMQDIANFEESFGEICKGTFVIFFTGWERFWNEPEKYRNELKFPSVSMEAAEYLLSKNVVGLGIDTLSPDTIGSVYPVHQLFLGAGKYLIENIANAWQLPPTGSFCFALPIKMEGGVEAPIRLIGMVLR